MIIITGTGRSGTSFMTKFLYTLYDKNLNLAFNPLMDAGYEDSKIAHFNDLWEKGKVAIATNFFNKNLNYFKKLPLIKDPRFYYNNNLHFIKIHFPKVKIVWMYRSPQEIHNSAQNLFNKNVLDSTFWLSQTIEDFEIQNKYFKFYLEKYNIPYIKFNYSDPQNSKYNLYNFCKDSIQNIKLSHFNNTWDKIIKN